ncbi:DnaB helicase C-terminal domain-containing protein [uncultured Methylophaga sp.]|uniref:DnaB helicase C-terminal domain-containing protein n=1 Tax=uncultured Methylophaga sp. TaxID=285271 RepID=UPI0026134B4A|nr:DnaB helicase C-terminal domain-containing protein [uncultured Methylophaga sp.]
MSHDQDSTTASDLNTKEQISIESVQLSEEALDEHVEGLINIRYEPTKDDIELASRAREKPVKDTRVLVDDYMRILEERSQGIMRHIPSGFESLDDEPWLENGTLVIIGGRPAMGKTAFGQQIAENTCSEDSTTLFFSLEMNGVQVTERSVSRRSGVEIPKIKKWEVTEKDVDDLVAATVEFKQLNLLVDPVSMSIQELVAIAHKVKDGLESRELPPLKCIVIDYLQNIEVLGRENAEEKTKVSYVSRQLKWLAKELDIPVVALCQLNRAVESRQDKRPSLSDLKESGQIEQDAEIILFIYRDEYYNTDSDMQGVAEIIRAKSRNGSTGTTYLKFHGKTATFSDMNKPESLKWAA